MFFDKKHCFWAPAHKTMQNHLEISSKNQFWIRNVEIGGNHKENMSFSKCIFTKAWHSWFPDIVFLMVLTCSWVSWPKNDAERFRNYFKKSVLDPKHAKIDQNPSFGHVRAVGGIMGYSGSVNFKHLLRYEGNLLHISWNNVLLSPTTWTLSKQFGFERFE